MTHCSIDATVRLTPSSVTEPFVDQVAVEFARDPDGQPPVPFGQGFERQELGRGIDMPLHDVAAQPVADRGGPLQIHPRAFVQRAEISPGQRFGRKIAPESVGLRSRPP